MLSAAFLNSYHRRTFSWSWSAWTTWQHTVMQQGDAFREFFHRVQSQFNATWPKLLKHAIHSLSLSPCDFHTFGSLQKALKFTSRNNVLKVLVQCFRQQLRDSLQMGYATLCIKETPIQMSVAIFPNYCNTVTHGHPWMVIRCIWWIFNKALGKI